MSLHNNIHGYSYFLNCIMLKIHYSKANAKPPYYSILYYSMCLENILVL